LEKTPVFQENLTYLLDDLLRLLLQPLEAMNRIQISEEAEMGLGLMEEVALAVMVAVTHMGRMRVTADLLVEFSVVCGKDGMTGFELTPNFPSRC
jgi:hypothetical protein